MWQSHWRSVHTLLSWFLPAPGTCRPTWFWDTLPAQQLFWGTLITLAQSGYFGQREYISKYVVNTLGHLTCDRLEWPMLWLRHFPTANTIQVKIKTNRKILPYNFGSRQQLKTFMKTKMKKYTFSPANLPQTFLYFYSTLPLSASFSPQATALTEHFFLVKHLASHNHSNHWSPLPSLSPRIYCLLIYRTAWSFFLLK